MTKTLKNQILLPSVSTLLSPIVGTPVQERFAVQHFIDALSDKDDRLYLGWEKPSTLDDALPFPRKRTRIPQTVG